MKTTLNKIRGAKLELAAQSEELRHICREMREAKL